MVLPSAIEHLESYYPLSWQVEARPRGARFNAPTKATTIVISAEFATIGDLVAFIAVKLGLIPSLGYWPAWPEHAYSGAYFDICVHQLRLCSSLLPRDCSGVAEWLSLIAGWRLDSIACVSATIAKIYWLLLPYLSFDCWIIGHFCHLGQRTQTLWSLGLVVVLNLILNNHE